jgi:hypothetical protein
MGGQRERIRCSAVMVQRQAFSVNQINPFRVGSGTGWPGSRYICLVLAYNMYLRKQCFLFHICSIP